MIIIRQLIEKYKNQEVAHFWIYLAEFFTRTGEFGLARDIYEEALDVETSGSIRSISDFGVVFNAYV